MKIYTKKGDHGTTDLIGKKTVRKNHPRCEACGELDELNAVLGMLISTLPPELARTRKDIMDIQRALVHAGTRLATLDERTEQKNTRRTLEQATGHLEKQIDAMQAELPELHTMILPGGHPSACWAHLARTVCRRVERRLVNLSDQGGHGKDFPDILQFINRMSDYLFVLARLCNRRTKSAEFSSSDE